MTTLAELIARTDEVLVRWTEAEACADENVTMSGREFRGLLAEIRDEAQRDGIGSVDSDAPSCYIKVAIQVDGRDFRIDVTANPKSILLV